MHANRPDGHPGDSGPGLRTRLRRALTAALKTKDKDSVSALRSALSAIGNAEAVDPGEPGPGRPGVTGSDHVAGAVPFERAGHAGRAAGLRHGTQALLAALDAGGAEGSAEPAGA